MKLVLPDSGIAETPPNRLWHTALDGLFRLPILTLALLLLWQVVTIRDPQASGVFPPPLQTVTSVFSKGIWWEVAQNALASLARVLIGFGLGAAVGIVIGVAEGVSTRLAQQLSPLVEMLRPVPPIAWIPLAILWFGPGDNAAVFIVAIGCSLPMALTVADASRHVSPTLLKVARVFGANRSMILRRIIIPSMLPDLFGSMRLGLGIGWASVIAAELVGAQSGLGYMIQTSGILLDTSKVIIGIASIGLIGYAMSRLVTIMEHRLLPWTKA